MTRKYDLISELYSRTCKTVVMYPQNWEAFLRSACRNFKLRFDEQLLVYAQRPDATAVLEIERWNGSFGRWVNRGAHGIAVFEDADRSKQRLIHYFDISDTHESRYSRPVPIWKMKPEYSEDIIDTLESTFGELDDKSSLEAAILSAAKNAVEDNIPDYLSDLLYSVENSLLDGVSEEEISVIYKETVQNSVAYMLMSRLGLDTEGFFEPDDFRGAVNFTTPETLNALGFATSDIAEMGLAEISRTITALDRQNRIIAGNGKADYNIDRENNERSFGNERDQIYNAGRLSASQPDNAGAAGSSFRQIRSDEEEVSERTSQSPLLQSSDELHSDWTLGGNRTESLDNGGNADKADGGEGRNHGEPESGGYDVVGSENEQSEEPGAGNRKGRSNLRLIYDRQHEDKSLPFFGGDEVINELQDTIKPLPSLDGQLTLMFEAEEKSSAFTFSEERRAEFDRRVRKNPMNDHLNIKELQDEIKDVKRHLMNITPLGDDDYYFYLPDKDEYEAMYFNLDSTAGGQIVIQHLSYELIMEAKSNSNSASEFYEYLANRAETELVVLGSPEYDEFLKDYADPHPDHIGRTEETMQALISQAERVSYDIGMGYLGNGLTVWNRAVEEHGDYQTIAHISNEGEVKYYVGGLPENVVVKIELAAKQEELKSLFTATYKVGDKVRLDGKPFEITRTDDWNVELMDRSLQNPQPRLVRKDSFMPLVWQNEYSEIKAENKNAIVLYQVGDFFELYGNDATYMSDAFVLNLKNKTVDGEIVSMCSIPSRQLETYVNMLTDRGNDVAIASLENGERIIRTVVSTNKEDLVQSQPVGKIEYLDEDGNVIHTDEYTSEYQFKKDIDEESSFGTRIRFYLYRDADGKTIDQSFITKSDTPLNVYEIIDSPYLAQSQQIEETHTEEIKPEPFTPRFEKPKRTRVQSFDLHPDIPMSERHTFNLASHEVEEVGKKERFRRNLMAIQLLKKCQDENRFATPDEQEILSKYVGWGGITEAFDENNSSWADEFLELSAALTPDEYESAKASVLTAFYTPPAVIFAIYKAMEQMGFREGNVLEPSCGIGNFIGMLPKSMQEAKIYGVEIDKISAGIAQQLYQKTSIAAQPFEEASVPDSFFDAIVGNVPFGDFKVNDKRYNKNNFLIHDYFFAKCIDKLRPGGVMALITSNGISGGTFDKRDNKIRKYIAQRCDLLGAIRLPNTTFGTSAGTDITTDIIFLQKLDRQRSVESGDIEWLDVDIIHENDFTNKEGLTRHRTVTLNKYYRQHPEMILGNFEVISGPFGPQGVCTPFNADLTAQLNEAISNIHAEITSYETEEELEEEDTSIPADPNVRNFSYTVVDDKIYYRENSRMTPSSCSATAKNRIKGMIAIRDCVRNLLEIQTLDYPDSEVGKEQQKLNELYDTFSPKYGLINSRANVSAFSQDSSFSLISALEVLDEEGSLERKADVFTKRTIKTHTPVTSVDTASEALAVSMGEKARVDMEYMCELTSKSEEEIYQDLKGIIFLNPMHGYGDSTEAKYLMADEYLSGNVREKLAWAKRSAEVYTDDYKINVEALEKVQPADLTASEIFVQLGTTWLPEEIVQQFVYEFLDTPLWARYNIKVHYSKFTSEWNIESKSHDRSNVKAYSTYGTNRINAYKIIEETLNMKDVRIFDYIEDDEGKKKAVLNNEETQIAQAKQELIKQGFKDWIWNDPNRREKLVKLYNEKFNSIRPREYDGSHIIFSGMNPEIELREHQKNAIAHILYGGNTLLAHAVGADKTFEMTAAAMESKRLGLCSKSLFVVPNHLTEQWAAEFLQLYPAANVLVATKKDFEKKNRKRFCGRIATGDYDAVIIGHSQFEKIPMSFERQRIILQQQIQDITDGIIELKANRGDKFSVKQLEKTKKSLTVKLEKLNDQSRKDDVVTFEELGIDRLFIDESHYYKNLFYILKCGMWAALLRRKHRNQATFL